MFPFNRSRIAVHEAGHAVMAMILGLDILECDISRSKYRRGQSGRCVVIDPDPIGLKRFLVSMGGVLSEHIFFGDDRGGGRDRYDAELSLFLYSSRYRRVGFDPRAEGIIRAISEHFREPICRQVVTEIAAMLEREGSINRSGLAPFEKRIRNSLDTSWLEREMESFIETPPEKNFRDTIRDWLFRLKTALERIRGF
ncbi:MAG: hypothetical protein Q7I97_03395 [Thermovirgaceae bacterium]|nr:hypothetical protein [Thermovirgaceae bacterium]